MVCFGGKQHGSSKQYYENGNIQLATTYSNGKKQGMQKWYYENGKLVAEIPFLDDKANGIIKYYTLQNKLVQGKYVAEHKLLWQITAQKGKLVNGKCISGKALTNSHLTKVKNDIEKDEINNWHTLCQ